MTTPDRLTVELCDKIAADENAGWVASKRELALQLADTMRENEKLRAIIDRIVAGEFDANEEGRHKVRSFLSDIPNKHPLSQIADPLGVMRPKPLTEEDARFVAGLRTQNTEEK